MKWQESYAKVKYIEIKCHCTVNEIFLTDPGIDFADCITGDVRLTDFSDNSEEDSRQGTIQICVNNAWGSVCSDHFFDNTDAAVFCGQLPGFKTDGI